MKYPPEWTIKEVRDDPSNPYFDFKSPDYEEKVASNLEETFSLNKGAWLHVLIHPEAETLDDFKKYLESNMNLEGRPIEFMLDGYRGLKYYPKQVFSLQPQRTFVAISNKGGRRYFISLTFGRREGKI